MTTSPQVNHGMPEIVPGRKYAVLKKDTIASLEAQVKEERAQLTRLGVSIRYHTEQIRVQRDQQEGILLHMDVLGEAIKELMQDG